MKFITIFLAILLTLTSTLSKPLTDKEIGKTIISGKALY